MAKKKRVWAGFIWLGLMLAVKVPSVIFILHHSKYSRVKIDALLDGYLGTADLTESIIDEVLLVSYSYNTQ